MESPADPGTSAPHHRAANASAGNGRLGQMPRPTIQTVLLAADLTHMTGAFHVVWPGPADLPAQTQAALAAHLALRHCRSTPPAQKVRPSARLARQRHPVAQYPMRISIPAHIPVPRMPDQQCADACAARAPCLQLPPAAGLRHRHLPGRVRPVQGSIPSRMHRPSRVIPGMRKR